MARKYYLRTEKKRGRAKLYTRVNRPSVNISWNICTGVEVDIKEWKEAQRSLNAYKSYIETEEGKKVNDNTVEVDQIITKFFEDNPKGGDKEQLLGKIRDHFNYDIIEKEKKIRQQKREETDRRLHLIRNYFDYFLSGIESREVKKEKGRNGKEYAKATIYSWRAFGRVMKEYTDRNKDVAFEDINKRFADGFILFLEKKGYKTASIKMRTASFCSLCRRAMAEGYNDNHRSLLVWSYDSSNDKRTEIALSDAETDALYNMPLKGIREQVRDIWFLGFLSGQRVSDFSRLRRENFVRLDSGLTVIKLNQQKTGNPVTIPVIDDRVFEICNKYFYNFPKLTRFTIAHLIKRICHKLSFTVPSLAEYVVTSLTVQEKKNEKEYITLRKRVARGEELTRIERRRYEEFKAYADEHESKDLFRRDREGRVIKQRWELVSSHTARRSAITSLYDSGLLDNVEIMSISGHKSFRAFEMYIKRDGIKQAEKIAAKLSKAKEIKMKKHA